MFAEIYWTNVRLITLDFLRGPFITVNVQRKDFMSSEENRRQSESYQSQVVIRLL